MIFTPQNANLAMNVSVMEEVNPINKPAIPINPNKKLTKSCQCIQNMSIAWPLFVASTQTQ